MTIKVGCQAVAFGPQQLKEDLSGALDKIAAVGYRGVEIGARFLNLDAPEANQDLFASRGLTVAGLHHGGPLYDSGKRSDLVGEFERIARAAKILGCSNVIVSGAGKEGFSLAHAEAHAETLNRIGEACAFYGCRVLYHNHHWEFADGAAVIRKIVDLTNPDNVGLATDLGWARMAGMAPTEVLLNFFERIGHLHVRDFKGQNFVELGLGDEDNAKLVQLLKLLGYNGWVVVEMELHAPRYGGRLAPAESIAVGYGYLNALLTDIS